MYWLLQGFRKNGLSGCSGDEDKPRIECKVLQPGGGRASVIYMSGGLSGTLNEISLSQFPLPCPYRTPRCSQTSEKHLANTITGCPLEVTCIILSRYFMILLLAFNWYILLRCITSAFSVLNIIVVVSILLSDGVMGVIHIFRHKYSLIPRRT